MASYQAQRTGNWSDTSNSGPWNNGVSVTAYPGQNQADSVDINNQTVTLDVSPAHAIALSDSGGL